ncbi:hypothetical protein T05_14489, partial [Trichinella murrelli]
MNSDKLLSMKNATRHYNHAFLNGCKANFNSLLVTDDIVDAFAKTISCSTVYSPTDR